MATALECDAAVRTALVRLAALDPEVRRRYVLTRSVSCRVVDLGVTYSGRLHEDGVRGLTTEKDGRAQVRLAVDSDDLVALVAGRLPVATAVAVGRLRVQANPLDVLRLRALL